MVEVSSIHGRVARRPHSGWIRGAPDLAVEVLSRSDSSSQVQREALGGYGGLARLAIPDQLGEYPVERRREGPLLLRPIGAWAASLDAC